MHQDDAGQRAGHIDRRQFTELLRTNDGPMRALAFRLLGSQAGMDDALQDAYIKAYNKRDQFQGTPDQFGGWLYRIVYNTCLDHLRRRKRRNEVTLDETYMMADQAIAVGDHIVQRSAINAALRSLTPDQAAAFSLVDGEGYSYDDAAEILEVPMGTVASRVHRARATMREQLNLGDESTGSGEVQR